jgi:hypothetical protein
VNVSQVELPDVRDCRAFWLRAIACRKLAGSVPDLRERRILLASADVDATRARQLMHRLGVTR